MIELSDNGTVQVSDEIGEYLISELDYERTENDNE